MLFEAELCRKTWAGATAESPARTFACNQNRAKGAAVANERELADGVGVNPVDFVLK